jgi:outer membrane assembly lipoprotein YfiO
MNKKFVRIIVIASIFIFCCGTFSAFAVWIWTPETGRWINPKHSVKDTPEEQFQLAISLWQDNKFEKALVEFKKLVKYYPRAALAAEALYYIGRIYENLGKYHAAFKSYQKVVDKYPFTQRVDEIIEREYQIGNLFYTKKKIDKWWNEFISGSAEEKAIEIFSKVVENSPYGNYAPIAQFKIGLTYKNLKRWEEAKQAFQKVIIAYSDSELMDDAIYQIALIQKERDIDPQYAQEDTEEAIASLENFMKENPTAELHEEAKQVIDELKNKKAASLFNTAQFYERRKHLDSAAIYYKEIVDNYPNTSWATKALEKLTVIRKHEGSSDK